MLFKQLINFFEKKKKLANSTNNKKTHPQGNSELYSVKFSV